MRHELLIELWKREELRRTPHALLSDPPSYAELAARFTVPYGRRLAELRALKPLRRS